MLGPSYWPRWCAVCLLGGRKGDRLSSASESSHAEVWSASTSSWDQVYEGLRVWERCNDGVAVGGEGLNESISRLFAEKWESSPTWLRSGVCSRYVERGFVIHHVDPSSPPKL